MTCLCSPLCTFPLTPSQSHLVTVKAESRTIGGEQLSCLVSVNSSGLALGINLLHFNPSSFVGKLFLVFFCVFHSVTRMIFFSSFFLVINNVTYHLDSLTRDVTITLNECKYCNSVFSCRHCSVAVLVKASLQFKKKI